MAQQDRRTVPIDPSIHQALKHASADTGRTIRELVEAAVRGERWAVRAVAPYLDKRDK